MARRPAVRRPSQAEIDAAVKQSQIRATAAGVPAAILAAAVFALACTPVARAVAGKHTELFVSITFSLTIVLSITTALGAGFAAIYRRGNRRLKTRNDELEAMIKDVKAQNTQLEQELTAAHGRIQDLEEAVRS